MQKLLKAINFRYTDIIIYLVVGLSVFIFIDALNLYGVINPNTTIAPFWLSSLAFVLLVIGFLFFLFLENRNNPISYKRTFLIAVAVLAVIGTVAIFIQPEIAEVSVNVKVSDVYLVGEIIDVNTLITRESKFVFFYGWINNIILCSIAVFIIPHRFKTCTPIKVLGISLYAILVVAIIYSFIKEIDKYQELINRLILQKGDLSHLEDYGIKSFFNHRNIFATFIETAIATSLVCYALTHKKLIFIATFIAYIFLLLTICKTGIIIVTFSLFIYALWLSIVKIKEGNKKGKILLIVTLSILVVLAVVLTVSILTNDKIKGMVSNFGTTFITRTYIWQNTLSILSPSWWLIGRGYGSFNLILHNVNIAASMDNTASTHSLIFSALGRVGIVGLLFITLVLIYIVYLMAKLYKKDRHLILSLAIASLIYFAHSLLEDNQYILFVSLAALLLIEKIENSKELEAN